MQPRPLSRFPKASFRELLFLSIPLIFSLFSASFMNFCDRLFLAHYSVEALQGTVSAGYLCMLFQHPIIRIASMAQVFVGLQYGSRQTDQIGASVWQMIWLSFLSMLVTLPSSQFVAPFFFEGTTIRDPANTYFMTMMAMNFLFPLGTAISSYFIGQGRTGVILLTTLIAHSVNIVLDYFFIFGIKGVLAPMGVFGAALATGIAQGVFCLILFILFLRKKEREMFGTNQYKFDWENFWGQLRIGLPRAIARIIILTAWVSTARIMTLKGGDHLMVLSIGGTLILFFTFINDGMLQGMITIASYVLGAKEYSYMWKLVRSGMILLLSTTALLSIPMLAVPELTLSFFFPTPPSPETMIVLKKSCLWIWFFFFCYGFNAVGLSLVTAARDVTFYMFTILFVWLTSYLPAYLAMNVFNWSPDKLWLIMACDSFIFGAAFLIRATKEKWKEIDKNLELENLSS
ncbi:MAG: hypothetical protein JSS30_02335 [Verrucomicrobia bacterium]|nr:hypothetical protein [Verrucomicrobiota bacterium]